MQRKKLGTAVIWMVCLLGMVAVVWSRPPMGGSATKDHPPLALAGPDTPEPTPQNPAIAPTSPPVRPGSVQPLSAEEIAPGALPARIWVREIAAFQISLHFNGNRLVATCQGRLDETNVECRISADYHFTKDAILYGVITSAELSLASDEPEAQQDADATARLLFDQPFSCRYRLDEDTLTIKDFKMGQHTKDSNGVAELANCVIGCYHPAPPQNQR